MHRVEFKSGNNELVRGVLFEPSPQGLHPAIILAHGLASTHEEFGNYPEKFSERGHVALAIDFRGHGQSDGMRGLVSEERLVEDLQRALDFIIANRGVDAKRIALFGHSFGGGAVLCAAAQDRRVSAVIAGATVGRLRDELGNAEYLIYRAADVFNRLQKIITHKSLNTPYRVTYKDIFVDAEARAAAEAKGFLQRTLPLDNVPLLLKQDALACARTVRVPALIIASEFDRVVKQSSTRRVFDALAGQKEWYVIRGSGHSFATDGQSAEAFEKITAWLDAHVKT